jgi:hypothetical protein
MDYLDYCLRICTVCTGNWLDTKYGITSDLFSSDELAHISISELITGNEIFLSYCVLAID